MDINLLVAFWIVSFALVMTPGADWAYAISAGMRSRTLLPAVTGMLLGYFVITLVVAAGVGLLVIQFPVILTLLTWCGAAYLLWLGLGVLRDPPVPRTEGVNEKTKPTTALLRGFIISGLNPKALLLFLALLPQFTNRQAPWPVSLQIGAMGMVQIANCAAIYTLVGLCSRAVLSTRPSLARRVSQLSGTAMIVIALLLIAEQFITRT